MLHIEIGDRVRLKKAWRDRLPAQYGGSAKITSLGDSTGRNIDLEFTDTVNLFVPNYLLEKDG